MVTIVHTRRQTPLMNPNPQSAPCKIHCSGSTIGHVWHAAKLPQLLLHGCRRYRPSLYLLQCTYLQPNGPVQTPLQSDRLELELDVLAAAASGAAMPPLPVRLAPRGRPVLDTVLETAFSTSSAEGRFLGS